MHSRDELIKELSRFFNCNCEHCYGRQEVIARHIVEQQAAITAKHREEIDNIKQVLLKGTSDYTKYSDGITQALSLIAEYKKDKK